MDTETMAPGGCRTAEAAPPPASALAVSASAGAGARSLISRRSCSSCRRCRSQATGACGCARVCACACACASLPPVPFAYSEYGCTSGASSTPCGGVCNGLSCMLLHTAGWCPGSSWSNRGCLAPCCCCCCCSCEVPAVAAAPAVTYLPLLLILSEARPRWALGGVVLLAAWRMWRRRYLNSCTAQVAAAATAATPAARGRKREACAYTCVEDIK